MSRPIKVLLVEDNPAEVNLIDLQLGNAKLFRPLLETVSTIADAEALLSRSTFDVILLDFHLPDCDDLSGLSRVLARAGGAPVIMLTNYENEAIATETVRMGAQDYLFKRDLDTPLMERSILYAMERQTASEALKASEQRYSLALAGVKDGIWDWDIASGTFYMSDRLYEMLGYDIGASDGDFEHWLAQVHPDDRDGFDKVLNAHMVGAIPYLELEFRLRINDGNYLWVLCRGLAVRGDHGEPVRMAGSVSDVSRRKAIEEQLIHDALHDDLTGLPNRSLFLDRVAQAMAVAQRKRERQFAIIFIDLNRFKNINDSLGHTMGNRFLKAVADRLRVDVRPSDTLARLGGDEFALLITDFTDFNSVLQIADRVHAQMALKFVLDSSELYTGASLGIATCSENYKLPEEILRDADIAMYRAKRSGRPYEVFDAKMRSLAVRRLTLETDLRKALEESQLEVYYQPILAADSGALEAFEALVRWNHPQRGLVLPGTFIKVAEDTGLVIPIGWWVFEQVVKDFKLLHEACPETRNVKASINMSGKIFNTGSIAKRLTEILKLYDFDARLLSLEITEHAVMDHQSRALKELTEIRNLGLGLHIDDFGTGYSSLSHLQKFSYDTLKIDTSFVRGMIENPENQAIVRSIIAMGKLLGMDVVAEGVETEEQLAWLRKIGCPKVQGFLFSEAVAYGQVGALLRQPFDAFLKTVNV